MPEISYSPQVTPESLPGRAFPHLPGEVPAGAFGQAVGRGIEYAGEEAQRVADQTMQQARQTQLTDAHNQLQSLSLGLTHDPQTGFFTLEGKNALGAGDGYLSKFDEGADQIISGVKDPRAQAAARLAAAQVKNHLSEQIDTHTIEQMRQYSVKTAQTSVELAEQTAAANYNHPDILSLQRDHIDASLENLGKQQGWSDEMLNEAKYQHHVKMNEGVLENMLGDNKPDMAKAYYDNVKGELRPQDAKRFEQQIQAGQVKSTADSIVGAYRQDTNLGADQLSALEKRTDLTPEQQSHIIQQVEQGRRELAIQRQQDPGVRRQMTALDGAIATGTVTQGSLGTVESLWRRGALTDEQRLVMRDQILRKTKDDASKNDAVDFVRDRYTSRTPIENTKENDRAVNLFLAESTVGSPPGSTGYNNMATEITARTGIAPSGAIAWGRAGLVGGDAEAAGQAAQFLASLQRANPRAYEAATDKETRAMAASINEMTAGGTPSDKAVDVARKNSQLSQAERQQLNQRWNQQKQGQGFEWQNYDSHIIKNDLSADEHYTTPGRIWGRNASSVPDIPPEMTAEFSTLTRDYFNYTGGNLKLSQQLALADLKGSWGVSEVNGKRELMKYAPERMFPGLTAEDIRYDLGKEGYGAAHLVESAETASSGGKRWSIAEKDDFGMWRPVTDSRGRAVTYELPQHSKPYPFEQELQEYEDKQKLEATKKRESFAAEHPVMGAGF